MYKYLQLNERETIIKKFIELIHQIGIERLEEQQLSLFYNISNALLKIPSDRIRYFYNIIKSKYQIKFHSFKPVNHSKAYFPLTKKSKCHFKQYKNKNSIKKNYPQSKLKNNDQICHKIDQKQAQLNIFQVLKSSQHNQMSRQSLNAKKLILLPNTKNINWSMKHNLSFKQINENKDIANNNQFKIFEKTIKEKENINSRKQITSLINTFVQVSNHKTNVSDKNIQVYPSKNFHRNSHQKSLRNSRKSSNLLLQSQSKKLSNDKIKKNQFSKISLQSQEIIKQTNIQTQQQRKVTQQVSEITQTTQSMNQSLIKKKKKRKILDINFWVGSFSRKYQIQFQLKQSQQSFIKSNSSETIDIIKNKNLINKQMKQQFKLVQINV